MEGDGDLETCQRDFEERGLTEDPSVLDLQHSDGVKCAAQLCTLSCIIDC